MTAIAGVVGSDGKVYIGGDSAGVNGGLQSFAVVEPKVFVNRGVAFGYTSSFRMGQLLQHRFTPPLHDETHSLMAYMVGAFTDGVRTALKNGGFARKENEVESGGDFLIGYRGHLFRMQGDFAILESQDGFEAVGCGDDLCRGALFATRPEVAGLQLQPAERIEIALLAATQFSGGVRAPYVVVHT